MEDEIQKRNTDCVYFLASPLTCKKGIECEYRHSEIARLNPRDCWFWLAGNCLNPTCAFRHPPLDGRPETASEPATLPINKTNVPCYFYFNGFCNKGDKCTFLHGLNGISPTPKASKSFPTVPDNHHLENKSSTGSDAGPQLIEAPPNPSDTTSKAVVSVQFQPKEEFQQSIPNDVVEQSPSPQISIPDCEEAMVTPLPAEDFIDNRSLLSPYQSSEEQVGDHTEPEELWESSPGLDVLVDYGLENLDYEDNPEYSLVHDREARELNTHLLQYDYKDPSGYDPMEYPGPGIFYEHGIYDPYDGVDDDNDSNFVKRVPEHSSERMLDPMFPKRKFLPRQLEIDGRNSMDLRDHLRKRRRINGHQASRNPKRHGSSFRSDRSEERHENHVMGHRRRGRLASEVRKNMVGVHSEKDTESNGRHRRGWMKNSKLRRNRSKHRDRERWQARPQFLPSEVSRGPTLREMRPTEEAVPFTGPKTLSQIKEEKRKAWASEDGFTNAGGQSKTTSEGFDGPKPLREILQDKRRLNSVSDDDTSRRSKQDHVESEKHHCHFDEDEDDFVDENDDDGLEKKLACIFS